MEIAGQLVDGLFTGQRWAGVKVDVVLHQPGCLPVAGDLDNRHQRAADGRSVAGGKHAHLRAAGGHARHRRGVVAGSIHNDQALLLHGNGLGIVIDRLNDALAALVDAAQRFFLQGGQAAGDVAGGRVAQPDIFAAAQKVLLIPSHDIQDPLPDLRGGGPLHQDVLRADELRGFAEDHAAALSNDPVAEGPDHRVCGNTAGGIAAAALRGQQQLGNGNGLLLQPGGLCRHSPGRPNSLFHRAQGATLLADDKGFQGLIGALADLRSHHIALAGLTPDGHQNGAVYVGVGGKARHHVQGILHIAGHLGAAHLIVEAHRPLDLGGNAVGRVRGAHAGRQDQHIIPHTGAAVAAGITVKVHGRTSVF